MVVTWVMLSICRVFVFSSPMGNAVRSLLNTIAWTLSSVRLQLRKTRATASKLPFRRPVECDAETSEEMVAVLFLTTGEKISRMLLQGRCGQAK
jgi:hypothetical protein